MTTSTLSPAALFFFCSMSLGALADEPSPVSPSDSGVVSAVDAPLGIPAQLDDMYQRRDEPGVFAQSEKLVNAALVKDPKSYDLLWRSARLKYWLSDGGGADTKQVAKEGWALAERALEARKEGLEGHYYAALNIGVYSQAVGLLRAIAEGLDGKFSDHLDVALRLEPGFDFSGPLNAKGRYYSEMPWPKRNIDKSMEYLKKAIEVEPRDVRAYFFLAENYMRDDKVQEAKAALDKLYSIDGAYNPGEVKRIRLRAMPLRQKVEKMLPVAK